jgi:hypothetical protein
VICWVVALWESPVAEGLVWVDEGWSEREAHGASMLARVPRVVGWGWSPKVLSGEDVIGGSTVYTQVVRLKSCSTLDKTTENTGRFPLSCTCVERMCEIGIAEIGIVAQASLQSPDSRTSPCVE